MILIQLAIDPKNPVELEEFLALIGTTCTYLENERFQKHILADPKCLETCLLAADEIHARNTPEREDVLDSDDKQQLTKLQSKLAGVLSDISALPDFSTAYSLDSSFVKRMRTWLLSTKPHQEICACVILGNLARSDEACTSMVQTEGVHVALISLLESASDTTLIHGILSFLKNLSIPQANKELLMQAGIFDTLPRLWKLTTTPAIQLSALSLTRLLILNCPTNISHLLESPLVSGPEADSLTTLSTLFSTSDTDPLKMEISRIFTTICRNAYHTSSSAAAETPNFFSAHPHIAIPLRFIATQSRWPILRSEGIFVFALMARSDDGARCIATVLDNDAALQPLVELLSGHTSVAAFLARDLPSNEVVNIPDREQDPALNDDRKSPSDPSDSNAQESSTANTLPPNQDALPTSKTEDVPHARADRENALVLVTELLRRTSNDMSDARRTLLQQLLAVGGESVVKEREVGGGKEAE